MSMVFTEPKLQGALFLQPVLTMPCLQQDCGLQTGSCCSCMANCCTRCCLLFKPLLTGFAGAHLQLLELQGVLMQQVLLVVKLQLQCIQVDVLSQLCCQYQLI